MARWCGNGRSWTVGGVWKEQWSVHSGVQWSVGNHLICITQPDVPASRSDSSPAGTVLEFLALTRPHDAAERQREQSWLARRPLHFSPSWNFERPVHGWVIEITNTHSTTAVRHYCTCVPQRSYTLDSDWSEGWSISCTYSAIVSVVTAHCCRFSARRCLRLNIGLELWKESPVWILLHTVHSNLMTFNGSIY